MININIYTSRDMTEGRHIALQSRHNEEDSAAGVSNREVDCCHSCR